MNTARTLQWMDQYEEAQVNQYSFNVLLLVHLYRTASASGTEAPLPNSQMQELTGEELDRELARDNTVLDLQAQVSTLNYHV